MTRLLVRTLFWLGPSALTFSLFLFAAAQVATVRAAPPPPPTLTIVVMDPLAAPLSCPCVKGYAQRDYDRLAKHLEAKLKQPVRIAFNESLSAALRDETGGKADIVIGKHSVVASYAKKLDLPLEPKFALAGKDGKTTMQGLVVVPAADPARSIEDLKGYRVVFGPDDCDEKHAVALALLRGAGVEFPKKLETCEACSDGALKILELGPNVRAATVISSYAAPLLEGCGTIKKGDLRVVGKTADVPFVELFVSSALDAELREKISAVIASLGESPELLLALETQRGFVPLAEKKKVSR